MFSLAAKLQNAFFVFAFLYVYSILYRFTFLLFPSLLLQPRSNSPMVSRAAAFTVQTFYFLTSNAKVTYAPGYESLYNSGKIELYAPPIQIVRRTLPLTKDRRIKIGSNVCKRESINVVHVLKERLRNYFRYTYLSGIK